MIISIIERSIENNIENAFCKKRSEMDNKLKLGAIICAVIGVICIAAGLILPGGNKTFIVSFDTDGGSTISSQEVKENSYVSMPVNPTKEDYTFVRWESDNKAYDFTSKVTSNITLKAIWEKQEVEKPKLKVTLVLEKEEKEIEVTDASEINIDTLGFKEKDGYEIKWYLDGKEYDLSTKLESDIKLEGKYVKVITLTVKFDSKGGTTVKSQKLKSGEKATEPTDVTYEGFIFEGWYLNKDK